MRRAPGTRIIFHMRRTAQAPFRLGRALAVAVVAAAALAFPATPAGADADPALFASRPNLHEVVELARQDVHQITPAGLSSEHLQSIDRAIRETAQERLASHLVNLSGQPHFDPIWTHYIVEGRRRVSLATRGYHVRACPICNVALRELGGQTGVSLPELVVPFATVQLGDAYFKVDPKSGRIFRIVDPIKGTPSYVSTGRLVMSDGRWWVINGTQRTGPIRTRESTRLPWDIHSQAEARAAGNGTQPPAQHGASPTRSAPVTGTAPSRRPPAASRFDLPTRSAPLPSSASSGRAIPLRRATTTHPSIPPPTRNTPAAATATEPATARAPAPAWPSTPAPAAAPPPAPSAAPARPSTPAPAAAPNVRPSRTAILQRHPTGASRAIPASELAPDDAATNTNTDPASSSPDGDAPAHKPFWQ